MKPSLEEIDSNTQANIQLSPKHCDFFHIYQKKNSPLKLEPILISQMKITGIKRTTSMKTRRNSSKTHRFTNIQKHKRPGCHNPETQKQTTQFSNKPIKNNQKTTARIQINPRSPQRLHFYLLFGSRMSIQLESKISIGCKGMSKNVR